MSPIMFSDDLGESEIMGNMELPYDMALRALKTSEVMEMEVFSGESHGDGDG